MKPLQILLVDDEEISREYITGMPFWTKGEFTIAAQAKGAKEALAILKKTEIDIVLMDVFMPDGNGVYLSEKIRERFGQVAMLAISSYDTYDYVRDILKNGAHDYLLKHQLNETTLEEALKAVQYMLEAVKRGSYRTTDESYSLQRWVFGAGAFPFTVPLSRLALTIYYADHLHQDKLPHVQDSVTSGIVELLTRKESGTQVMGLYKAPHVFIMFTLFLETSSEAEMQKILYVNTVKSINSVWEVFHIQLTAHQSPLYSNYDLYPAHIQKQLAQRTSQPKEKTQLTVTLAQRKALLIALEEKSYHACTIIVTEIYARTKENDTSALMLITKELLTLLEQAAAEFNSNGAIFTQDKDFYHWILEKTKEEIVVRVLGMFRLLLQEAQNASTIKYSASVQQALHYIETEYHQNVGLQETADKLEINSAYLSRRFREETGQTFISCLNNVRIAVAKANLLLGMPIRQVAVRSGFQRYDYFLKVFKEYTALTPTEYIEQYAKR